MIDLKGTSEDMDAVEAEKAEYPWGLKIHLNEEVMKKMKQKVIKAGTKVQLTCAAYICKTEIEDDGEGEEQSMSIQITGLDIKPVNDKSIGETLYND